MREKDKKGKMNQHVSGLLKKWESLYSQTKKVKEGTLKIHATLTSNDQKKKNEEIAKVCEEAEELIKKEEELDSEEDMVKMLPELSKMLLSLHKENHATASSSSSSAPHEIHQVED